MLLIGNSLEKIDEIKEKSVQAIVTSPPYWGLRDYNADGQLGEELVPEDFVRTLTLLFNKSKRVLKDDGTLWLNIGDTYFGAKGGHWEGGNSITNDTTGSNYRMQRKAPPKHPRLKTKDLTGIPWRVAFALQADGWYLRQDIIWHKPNPMPEAVKDRCTKSHEYIFLLTKSAKYFYDADAIKENTDVKGFRGGSKVTFRAGKEQLRNDKEEFTKDKEWFGRNKRSVWKMNTKPYKEAHFAVFPPELPELCIKAGSSEGDIVLDPFFGSGTTGWVAQRLGRKWIGIELNEEYIKIAEKRFQQQELFVAQ